MHTNMRILLASNSKVLSSILSRSLASIGYGSVLEAKDGGEALCLCSAAEVDLLFIDWAMPGVGAAEFIERTRTEGAHKKTPILIAVLPDAQEETRELCADGLVETIVKPFSPKALRQAIAGLSPAGEPAMPETTETAVHTRLVSLIVESAKKTFETMAFSKLEAAVPHLRMGPEGPPAWYSCTIGINGSPNSAAEGLRGNVSMIFGERTAESALRSMVMMGPDDAIELEDVMDAVGELTNMTVGGARADAQKGGLDFCISLPAVVVGANHQVAANDGAVIYVVEMSTAAGALGMNLVFE